MAVKEPTGGLKKACWKGYSAVGIKIKNGKKVPNCVPVKEDANELSELSSELLQRYKKKASKQMDAGKLSGRKTLKRGQGYLLATVKQMRKEEVEVIGEKSEQARRNKTLKNVMDASRGARAKRQGIAPDPQPQHKTPQAHNKAIGRAMRSIKEGYGFEGKHSVAPTLAKHIVSVTLTDPNHQAVSMRKEKVFRRAVVNAPDKKTAINIALKHYKKLGMRVHDHEYVGIKEEVEQDCEVLDEISSEVLRRAEKAAREKPVKYGSDSWKKKGIQIRKFQGAAIDKERRAKPPEKTNYDPYGYGKGRYMGDSAERDILKTIREAVAKKQSKLLTSKDGKGKPDKAATKGKTATGQPLPAIELNPVISIQKGSIK